jgi:hypothetical protein
MTDTGASVKFQWSTNGLSPWWKPRLYIRYTPGFHWLGFSVWIEWWRIRR